MTKTTTTLAGLAILAATSIAPAFAQGSFTTNGPFTFSLTPTSFMVTSIPVTFNPLSGGTTTAGTLTLTGATKIDGSPVYSNTMLSFTNGTFSIMDTVPLATVVALPSGAYSIASVGTSAMGDSFNLTGGSPVPEASTVVSFGALLALGGLAFLRRKSASVAA